MGQGVKCSQTEMKTEGFIVSVNYAVNVAAIDSLLCRLHCSKMILCNILITSELNVKNNDR